MDNSDYRPFEDITRAFLVFAKGYLSGVAGAIPLSFVQQAHSALQVRHFSSLAIAQEHGGLLRVFFNTISSEGVGALFRGVGYPLLGQTCIHGVLFGTYYMIRSSAEVSEAFTDIPRLAQFKYKFSGAVAGFLTSFVECPIDLVTMQMRTQTIRHITRGEPYLYKNHFHCLDEIVKNYGVRVLFYGWVPTVVRSVGAYYVMFSAYEDQLQSYANNHDRPVGDVPLITAAYFGAFAGTQGVVAGYVFANVKNVMQADYLNESRRIVHTVTDSIRFITGDMRHPWRAFLGIVPAVMFAIPAYGSLFAMAAFVQRRYFTQSPTTG